MHVEQLLDLICLEAGKAEVEPEGAEIGHLRRQHRIVPARIEGEPVVGEDVGALLRLAHVPELDHRHHVQLELPCRQEPAVAGHHAIVAVDEDRVGPAELEDRGGDLRDLSVGVGPGVPGVGDQPVEGAVLHLQRPFVCGVGRLISRVHLAS